ncbi:BMC domain-containing protein [Fundicoccus culcitae]|uniref:BMC domain-containing protein n=1 Tax=Fundicoccus culcitae TaxID=2969821 RepID=A0ABY5P3L9_9LACT|nr:BMC domain-containing protein [Fundicoccus culcitae]UUX33322.1 BMC domain-containing protein [Fundicoccus culcitae]
MDSRERVIQEYVPGKQITLAHVIANPDEEVYGKIGINRSDRDAIGIMTITPSETAIIAVDIAVKAANVEIDFMDRFTGSLVISGDVSSVKIAIKEIVDVLSEVLGFNSNSISSS